MTLAVVRVRGTSNVRGDVKETLRMLRLHRPNHCVVLPPTDPYLGMLQKTKDFITWGEVTSEVLARLLTTRARLEGNKPLTKKFVKDTLGYASFEKLAEEIVGGKVNAQALDKVKPVFRLSSPKKGYEGIKRPFADGGALGYRGEAINDLLVRMLE